MTSRHRSPSSTTVAAYSSNGQRGFTLIELMVALALGMLITGAAVAALLAARQGFNSVDDAGQLRENARFTSDLIQRIAVQAGFEDVAGNGLTGQPVGSPPQKGYVGIQGFDNAVVSDVAADPVITSDSRSSACAAVTDTSCQNGSDVLVVRYLGISKPGTTTPDGSMINCAGFGEPERTDMAPSVSIFHVTRSASGEPTLTCSFQDGGVWRQQSLVQGVESFQVLYGVRNVTATATSATPDALVAFTANPLTPELYLTAKQMVGATAADTDELWRRVRSMRIGVLFRGAPNQAISKTDSGKAWHLLGVDAPTTTDSWSSLTTAADGRVRQQLLFEVHLRNPQRIIN